MNSLLEVVALQLPLGCQMASPEEAAPKLVETIRVVVGELLDQHLASEREGKSWDADAAAWSTVAGRLLLQL